MDLSVAEHVALALKGRLPFDESDPFQPRSINRRVFYGKLAWHMKYVKLTPVAFKPNLIIEDCMGVICSHGSMSPYIWVDGSDNLIKRDEKGNYRPVDPSTLTHDEIKDLDVGVMGDKDLLDILYCEALEKACREIISHSFD